MFVDESNWHYCFFRLERDCDPKNDHKPSDDDSKLCLNAFDVIYLRSDRARDFPDAQHRLIHPIASMCNSTAAKQSYVVLSEFLMGIHETEVPQNIITMFYLVPKSMSNKPESAFETLTQPNSSELQLPGSFAGKRSHGRCHG